MQETINDRALRIRCSMLIAVLFSPSCVNAEPSLVLTNANLIDGNGGDVVYPATIEIDGERIARIC